ncbi:AmmeMemoRadiSam system protein B [Candidatus Falkowbacteria bacterium RIFOXYC2_FULL_48_21]|uniref:AmmeMemoRadiSam system protein B n=1 Tax=Candidatus Falkowbacteria bacterium RIFOXYC2_FULL_48_21 TaxID=1798005 RepID=A0A1F5TCT2_9BACT|nr:MAG: AmmeMemoRadiSam system protein B [Candidatus Falkowbacteria bacterium RIFOXYC2_FULL_48_21]
MLVFAAIVPHPPILIPQIGKDNLKKLKKTVAAFNLLEEDLNAARPDVIVVISPHGEVNFDAFTINTNQSYSASFENFGDFSTRLRFNADLGFINALKGKNETKLPIQLVSELKLDHGAAVPLFYLTRKNNKRRIVPITYSMLNYQKHIDFGVALKEAIFGSDKRIAIIASGDLSHRLSFQSPAGFSPRAKEFDKKLIQLLKKKSVDGVVGLDPELIENAGECGLRSFLILLGAIQKMNYEFEVLSYEAPFGVGYLVGEMKFT